MHPAKARRGPLGVFQQPNNLDEAARFWSQALGVACERSDDPADANYRQLDMPAGEVAVLVQQVEHPSRVHIDIETDDGDAEVKRLEALGAKRVQQVERWWVMEAPTGQRFCVVRPQRTGFEEGAALAVGSEALVRAARIRSSPTGVMRSDAWPFAQVPANEPSASIW